MSMQYPHLVFARQERITPRRQRPGRPPISHPDDPAAHGERLARELNDAYFRAQQQEPGFDPRLLIKLEADGLSAEDLKAIPGIQVISEESRTFTIVFADEAGRREFERRLNELAGGGQPSRKEILWAIRSIDDWTPDDRMGPALKLEGIPDDARFVVDVELWALHDVEERDAMLVHFVNWVRSIGARVIDKVKQPNLVLVRTEVTREQLERILSFRDVRQVDLPPRYDFTLNVAGLHVDRLPAVAAPPEKAPTVAVLDTGLATNHSLLAPAVGDAQSFVPGRGPDDEEGHGTQVAGHVVFGDLEAILEAVHVHLEVRVLSGRILVRSESELDDTPLVANRIRQAVEYFVRHYNCRIFNLSIGDLRKPYVGGHVRDLAAVLDELAFEYGVLFIVSAGNFYGTEDVPKHWLRDYPEYLLNEAARIIDPAPAVNVLTVGSIARRDWPHMSRRYPNDPGYQPIARTNWPSPFTRTGPGPGGAIKPELVEYGGNWSYEGRTNNEVRYDRALGEVTTNHDVVSRPFTVVSGTSFAAPKIAHMAARVLARYPNMSSEAIRALLLAHASVPDEIEHGVDLTEEQVRTLVGYGRPDGERVLSSVENCVTLLAEDEIEESTHHFYEIPLPEDFMAPPLRRPREITVALAYTSMVRRTHLSYRANKLSFRVVRANNLDEVVKVFRTQDPKPEKREPMMPEVSGFRPTSTARSGGNNQAATWRIKQIDKRWNDRKLYVVVTHQPEPWAAGTIGRQRYALAVVLRDLSGIPVRLYSQLRAQMRVKPRARWSG